MKNKIFKMFVSALTLGLSLAVCAETLTTSPVNPAFVKWLKSRKAKSVVTQSVDTVSTTQKVARLMSVTPATVADSEGEEEEVNYGYVPSVVDRSYLRNLNTGIARAPTAAGFPSRYDLRENGILTPIRNQNPYGTCWAHATFGSMESWIKKTEGVSTDFSEKNLAMLHGFDPSYDDGGNQDMAAAYLLRWGGPVNETTDPYTAMPNPSSSYAPVRHIQSVKYIPARANSLDNDGIKKALMDFGALYVDYYHHNSYYDANNASFYLPIEAGINHAVVIVGWDDTFSKNKFKSSSGAVPPANGAWIVRNSWGTWWGDNGYFYVSYYDANFANYNIAAFANAEPTDNYSGVYQYDDYGWVTSFGFGSSIAYGANIFKAANNNPLAAVGFYSVSPNTEYTITIRTGVTAGNPSSGTVALTQSGTSEYAQYLTVPLKSTVAVTSGQNFSVTVKFKTTGFGYPIASEIYYNGFSSNVTSSKGESFISNDGSTWHDLYNKSANVCIKAYSQGAAAVTLQSIDIRDGENAIPSGGSTAFTCVAVYSDGSSKSVRARWGITEGSQYASISSAGVLTANEVDSNVAVTIKAAYAEGGVSCEKTCGVQIRAGRPAAVTGLVATTNDTAGVRVSWNAVASATAYALYRAASDSSASAKFIAETSATTYFDSTATPGATYWYFVKAKNGSDLVSDFSASARGLRLLSAPAEVSASDGTSEDFVTVGWSEAAGASAYRVWRATGADSAETPAPISGFLSAGTRSYNDATAAPDVRYTYFVTGAKRNFCKKRIYPLDFRGILW